ncbi:MAG: BtpA/SgcQ family protein [Anaerolineae bacterium]|nr:BtpA/SgcQ family protein [Anaerolineae bacterium]
MNWINQVFGKSKPAVGMVHFLALPGAPGHDSEGGIEKIVQAAYLDLEALQQGGIDAVMFCNEHDRPYTLQADAAVVAAMSYVIGRLHPLIDVPFGVDVLWDPKAALAVARGSGALFVREIFSGVYASDMGQWNTDAGGALRYRRNIGAESVRVLYNINAEFAVPLGNRPLAEVAKSVVFSSIPDGLCVSGSMTSVSVSAGDLQAVKEVVADVPIFINTGARRENIADLIRFADGVIVGSSLKVDGRTWNRVDSQRVSDFMAVLRAARGE